MYHWNPTKAPNKYPTLPPCGHLQRCSRLDSVTLATVNQPPDSAFHPLDWTQEERLCDSQPIRCLCLLLTGLLPDWPLHHLSAAVIYRSLGDEDAWRGEEGRTREVMLCQTEEETDQPRGKCISTLALSLKP